MSGGGAGEPGRVVVVGSGTMGAGIAQIAAVAGHPVTVIDADAAALDRAGRAVAASLQAQVDRGRMAADDARAAGARIGWSVALADAAGADLVVEAVTERLDVKRELFAALEDIVDPHTLLTTNTSSLSVGDIGRGLRQAGRFLGLHFFNPVPAMKLVEVVAGAADGAALANATALMRAWGKSPVAVADAPGFIVNRVARPFYAEAFAAVGEGLSAEGVDEALVGAGGFRMGPLALADMIGQDVNYAVATLVFEALGDHGRFRPQPAQRALVAAGRLGRKSGQGVYTYPHHTAAPTEEERAPLRTVRYGGDDPLLRALCLAAGAAADAGGPRDAADVDGVAVAVGDGRPLGDRPGVDVLLDEARDPATAHTVVGAARGAEAAAAVAALAGAAGRRLVLVPDRPGLVVLRTLVQIANAAAECEQDGVASGADIDLAMMLGANHPEGPLAWADRVGPRVVGRAARHIADATGDPLYVPASRFRP